MRLLLGCIADDLTGASDLGLMLANHGMPTTLFTGPPSAGQALRTPAIVIALKIRTVDAGEAVRQAENAADYLLALGARQLYYKYCSTFDSTRQGNIGPVTDALLERLKDNFTVLLPAFPKNGRTVRNGELRVGGKPLAETSMRYHPLTPMTESSLLTLMDAQTAAGRTGLVPQATVEQGADAIRDAFVRLRQEGKRYAAVDISCDDDMPAVAAACVNLQLLTGASGIAAAIPACLEAEKLLEPSGGIAALPALDGHTAVLSGSCSKATQAQVERLRQRVHAIVVDPIALSNGDTILAELADTAESAAKLGDVLIHSTGDREALRRAQDKLGVEESAKIVESSIAAVARRLAASGIRKFIVAGGETSGAVSSALGITELVIGPEIDPGVPWMVSNTEPPICLALKSGNFGAENFFEHALEMLP